MYGRIPVHWRPQDGLKVFHVKTSGTVLSRHKREQGFDSAVQLATELQLQIRTHIFQSKDITAKCRTILKRMLYLTVSSELQQTRSLGIGSRLIVTRIKHAT